MSASPLRQHLLDIEDVDDVVLPLLFARAAQLQAGAAEPLPPTLRGQVVATLFFEPSTRTRLSFELAAQRLGALAMPFDIGRSSLEKSETLYDTVQTLAAMGVTAAVVRHREDAVFAGLSPQVPLALINAGNGTQAHPTQALLDAFTLIQQLGALGKKTVLICGDILHSRVARSNVKLLQRLGAQVIFSGPPQLLPESDPHAAAGSAYTLPLDEAIPLADAIMCLRVQRERHQPSLPWATASYLSQYGLTAERFATAPPHCLLMHPGPVNRDVELATELIAHPRSLILTQVRSGVYIRMAVMEWIAGVLPGAER
jgi:aspartate carbamoyltransferase catalytic subunit